MRERLERKRRKWQEGKKRNWKIKESKEIKKKNKKMEDENNELYGGEWMVTELIGDKKKGRYLKFKRTRKRKKKNGD